MLRRLTTTAMALAHVFLLTAANTLHLHGPETTGLELADLPAQYHHHDFGYAAGSEATPVHDDCIGCRLERSVAMPWLPVPGLSDTGTGRAGTEAPLALASGAGYEDPLPRAPPHA